MSVKNKFFEGIPEIKNSVNSLVYKMLADNLKCNELSTQNISKMRAIYLDGEQGRTTKVLLDLGFKPQNLYSPNYNLNVVPYLRKLKINTEHNSMYWFIKKNQTEAVLNQDVIYLDYNSTLLVSTRNGCYPLEEIMMLLAKNTKITVYFIVTFSRASGRHGADREDLYNTSIYLLEKGIFEYCGYSYHHDKSKGCFMHDNTSSSRGMITVSYLLKKSKKPEKPIFAINGNVRFKQSICGFSDKGSTWVLRNLTDCICLMKDGFLFEIKIKKKSKNKKREKPTYLVEKLKKIKTEI